jgi:hypothetical protein
MGLFDEALDTYKDVLYRNLYKELRLRFPDASPDLLKHFAVSQGLSNIISPVGSMAIGIGKELIDGTMGESAGKFSVDDLGADWAGAFNMSPEEAHKKGLFSHTEDAMGHKGYGQGILSDVLDKIRK